MAYDNPEVFGRLQLYENPREGDRELGRYGRKILVLAETSGDGAAVYERYLKVLGVLGMYGTEVARVRVIHSKLFQDDPEFQARTVGAEHVFFLPRVKHETTVLESLDGDNMSSYTFDDLCVTFDRKTSVQQFDPMGEVALQYDGLSDPPALRVIDVQGCAEDGHGEPGEPRSDLPEAMLPHLLEAMAA
jgi:hypothetical protein